MDQIVIAENCINLGDGMVAFTITSDPRFKRNGRRDLDLAPSFFRGRAGEGASAR